MPKIPHVALALLALLAAGCATTPPPGRVERLSPEQLAQVTPPAPRPLSVEDIVRLSRTTPPEELIKQYFQSGTRLRLTDQQRADMRARGVDQRVIDHIVNAEIEAQRTDRITAEVDRERAASQRFDQARRNFGYAPYGGYGPYGPRIVPYGGYRVSPWGSGWHGGFGIGF